MNNWGTIAFAVLLFVSRIQIFSCSGKLKIDLRRYENPGNKLKDNSCCELTCLNDCDPFFEFTFKGTKKELSPRRSGKDISFSSQSITFSFEDTWKHMIPGGPVPKFISK
ncbi:uncharacterized protein LOC114516688 [Dendronephthya gigantea]|uniref:uncharacterized protein LOC114516688 n=1 Tax=Dendronephthya gigantea TaxID=151771 RepID=UPI00106B4CF6|nr:uncharacterized protein LOC114516688 [Dendronephthya gigantea]